MPEILSPGTAYARGLRPLCGPYKPTEKWMLDNVVSDLQRGARRFAFVTRTPSSSIVEVFIAPAAASTRPHSADSVE